MTWERTIKQDDDISYDISTQFGKIVINKRMGGLSLSIITMTELEAMEMCNILFEELEILSLDDQDYPEVEMV